MHNLIKPRNKSTEKRILQLNSTLKTYGLCPAEWIVKYQSENVYRIENREAPEFYFEGKTVDKPETSTWKKIYLKSI